MANVYGFYVVLESFFFVVHFRLKYPLPSTPNHTIEDDSKTALFIQNGQGKTASFQTFALKNQATTLPVKQFDGGTLTVHEDKRFPAQGIAPHICANYARKGVEIFAHVLT